MSSVGKFHTVEEYLTLSDKDHVWVVRNVIPYGGYTTIFGKPKSGKSYAALQLAAAIGNEESAEWLSFPIESHGPVSYFQVDTPRGIWVDRVRELQEAGLSFKNVYFADTEDAPFPFNIMRDDSFSWLAAETARINPHLVIVDTLREVHGLNENESTSMQSVVSRIREACPRSAIMLVSHARKENPNPDAAATVDPIDEQRGSGYVAGRMDSIMRLSKNQLMVKGRSIADTHIGVKQDAESHMIVLADAFIQAALEVAKSRAPGESDRDLARHLQDRFPKKDYEACRSAIRRVLKKL